MTLNSTESTPEPANDWPALCRRYPGLGEIAEGVGRMAYCDVKKGVRHLLWQKPLQKLGLDPVEFKAANVYLQRHFEEKSAEHEKRRQEHVARSHAAGRNARLRPTISAFDATSTEGAE